MDSLQREEGGCKHIYRPIVAGPWVLDRHSLHPIVLSWPTRAKAEVWCCMQSQRAIWSGAEKLFNSSPSESFPLYSTMSVCEELPMGEYPLTGNVLGFSCFWPAAMVTTHSANMFSYPAWWEFKGFWPYMAPLRQFVCIPLIEKLSLYKCSRALHVCLSAKRGRCCVKPFTN